MKDKRKNLKWLVIKPAMLMTITGSVLIVAQMFFLFSTMHPHIQREKSLTHIILITIYLLFWIYTYVILKRSKTELEKSTDNSIKALESSIVSLDNNLNILEETITRLERHRECTKKSVEIFKLNIDDICFDDWCSIPDQKIFTLEVETKVKNMLIKNNIWTIRQLLSTSIEELEDRVGLGQQSLKKLRKALRNTYKHLHLEQLYVEEHLPPDTKPLDGPLWVSPFRNSKNEQ